jgi:hypothetical protein
MKTEKPSALVRAYVEKIGPWTKGKRAEWGEQWLAGTFVYAKQLMIAGLVVLILAWPHPEAGWQAVLASLGLLTMTVGWWHWRNAEAINRLGLERDGSAKGKAE